MNAEKSQAPNTPRILIAGAGPVGMTLAMELARHGIRATLVDRMSERQKGSRAVAVWPRTLELLEAAGVSAQLVPLGNQVLAANIVAGNRTLAQVGFGGVDSSYAFALMVPQDRTEGVLEARLEELGVQPQLGVELVALSQDGSGVDAVLRGADGQAQCQRFDWLVACDGAHSVVRHQLGLAFEGETLDTLWVQGDFLLEGFPFASSELGIYWHADGVLIFFPLGGGRFRVIAEHGHAQEKQAQPPSMAQFQSLIDQRGPGGIRLTQEIWVSCFAINERQVGNYRAGRIFLAGDAAHVHSPAGGQGMNTGMQDAINLAWKLAMARSAGAGAASDLLLDSYDAERRPVGAKVIEAAGRMTRLATAEGPQLQHIRNFLVHAVMGLGSIRDAMAAQMSELSVGYPSSPLTLPGHAGGVAPGARMRPVAGEPPYGAGARPMFALRGGAAGDARMLIERFPSLLEKSARPGPADGSLQLVRPDGYLAVAARAGDTQRLADYLQKLQA